MVAPGVHSSYLDEILQLVEELERVGGYLDHVRLDEGRPVLQDVALTRPDG